MGRYLVTGALGAVGVWTVRSLLERGHDVVAFDVGTGRHRLGLALSDEQQERIVHVHGDVADLPALERVLAEHEITNVIHLAALQVPLVRDDPVRGALVNVVGTVNVLEAVRRREAPTGPVVYASSIAATAPADGHPSTLYGVFKRANEGSGARYYEDFGVSSIGLRPHTVYGPGRDQGLTSAATKAIIAAAAGRPYRIPFGGALQLHYTPDAGEAFARASEASFEGAALHNVDGPVVSVANLIRAIEDAEPGARGLLEGGSTPLPFSSHIDARSFVALVGEPVCRPLADGIADALERFRALLADGRVSPPEG